LGGEFSEADLIVHDETSQELAFILANMEHPNYPPPMGVIRSVTKQDYTAGLMAQVANAQAQKGVGDLAALYSAGETWTVS
jgi:2-oxoglutarate/2-oxoacid ferredoxin oxidoreductase subunit beta